MLSDFTSIVSLIVLNTSNEHHPNQQLIIMTDSCLNVGINRAIVLLVATDYMDMSAFPFAVCLIAVESFQDDSVMDDQIDLDRMPFGFYF